MKPASTFMILLVFLLAFLAGAIPVNEDADLAPGLPLEGVDNSELATDLPVDDQAADEQSDSDEMGTMDLIMGTCNVNTRICTASRRPRSVWHVRCLDRHPCGRRGICIVNTILITPNCSTDQSRSFRFFLGGEGPRASVLFVQSDSGLGRPSSTEPWCTLQEYPSITPSYTMSLDTEFESSLPPFSYSINHSSGAMDLVQSRELAMIDQVKPTPFSSFAGIKRLIDRRRDDLKTETEDQHIALDNVSREKFEMIDRRRFEIGRGLTFTFFPDIATLIIKIPTSHHESGHRTFMDLMNIKSVFMGLSFNEFYQIGATRYQEDGGSSKEADSGTRNRLLRPNLKWPNFVIEAGMSESLGRLRNDAKWWLSHSKGDVSLLLVIKIERLLRKVLLEEWVPTPRTDRRTRSSAFQNLTPTCLDTVTIDCAASPPTVHGGPLVLQFLRLFGRTPTPPQEKDMVFTDVELLDWATTLWDT